MRRPSAFNVLVYQLQSGELEITPDDIKCERGYNDCPKDWDNICPFGCADSNREVQRLQKRLDEFVEAAHRGNLTKVRQLVAEGVDVNGEDSEGYNALRQACWYFELSAPYEQDRRLEVVKFLLERGAKVSVDILRIAEKSGNEQFIELLKAHGAK